VQSRSGDLQITHAPRQREKIRVGYLSADFHCHATAYLIAELIEQHDRSRFEIWAWSRGANTDDAMRQRLERSFDVFRNVHGQTDEAVARQIHAAEIDILVDLKGYTYDGVALIMSYRPAPIQVNYLGFPGTMGADFIDYILVDDFIAPPEHAPFYSEKLVHLPGCYQVNDSTRAIAPERPTRAQLGLPDDAFVYCDFNNSYKISPRMFAVWMRILHRVPGSVLWLLSGNRYMVPNIYREAAAQGIPRERIVFSDVVPLEEHLARVPLADLFLDTFPVAAHTTASDTLWAGCPLLTLVGESFISRVAGSLLNDLGLPELIARSFEEYETIAIRCGTDPAFLRDLRERLAARRLSAELFSGRAFARKVEAAYEAMWLRYQRGEPPQAIRVPPLGS
jgi:predicted O-linked N-acetylglucosamine transferase (SPINDLY family)